MLHRYRKQAAEGAEDIEGRCIDERALGVPHPNLVQITQGHGGNGGRLGAGAQQRPR